MPKTNLGDIVPVLKNTPDTNQGIASLQGIKMFKDITDNIRAMIKEAKSLQQVGTPDDPEPSKEVVTQSPGVNAQQITTFAKQFLDGLITQGLGDKTLLETLAEIPLTLKQLRNMIK